MSRLTKRMWENNMLTINTKMQVYQAVVLSTLLYGSEAWTLYSHQERRLSAFHLRCLRRLLNITWQDCVSNFEVSARAGLPSLFSILTTRRMRSRLGHVIRMDDRRILKDLLFGEQALEAFLIRSSKLLLASGLAGFFTEHWILPVDYWTQSTGF